MIVCVASRTSALVHRRVQHELMLLTELAVVRAAHVVLASASPRRVQILNEQLGINAVVMPSFFEENLEKSQYTPHEYVRENALQKALEVYNRLSEDDRPPSCVIGADTVVVLGDEVLEKPRDKADAAAMLATVLAYLPKIPSVLLASYLIDRKGRRWMLQKFVPPLAICLAVLAATTGAGAAPSALSAFAATSAVTLFGIFFGMSLGPLPNILAAELFPTAVRGVGVSATTTIQWSANMLVAFLFPLAAAKLGMTTVLSGFASVCVIAWIVIELFVPETKGKSLEEIGGEVADTKKKA